MVQLDCEGTGVSDYCKILPSWPEFHPPCTHEQEHMAISLDSNVCHRMMFELYQEVKKLQIRAR